MKQLEENQIELWIELPWPESTANTFARHTETLFICRFLPPDRTWHKVKSPKAD